MSGLFVTSVGAERLSYYFTDLASGREDCREQLDPGEVQFFGTWSDVPPGYEQLESVFGELKQLRRDQRFLRPIGNVGYDICFVAPKQVSILQALLPMEVSTELLAAHRTAVAEMVGLIEPKLNWKSNGRLSAVGFIHRTSRLLDPHLHTHLIVANRIEAAPGVLRALNSDELYARVGDWSVAFRHSLAREIYFRLGIVMIDRDLSAGSSGPTEIPGFPKNLSGLFSKRSVQVKELVDDWGTTTPGASRAAALITRSEKVSLDSQSLINRWVDELQVAGVSLSTLTALVPKTRHHLRGRKNLESNSRLVIDKESFIRRLDLPERGQGWLKLVSFEEKIYQRMEVFSLGRIVEVLANGKEVKNGHSPELSNVESLADPVELVLFGRIDADKVVQLASKYRHQNLVIAFGASSFESCDFLHRLRVTQALDMFDHSSSLVPEGSGYSLASHVPMLKSMIRSFANSHDDLETDALQSHLIFPTKHDRDLARAELTVKLGRKMAACGYYNSERVWIHYLPKGRTLGEDHLGEIDIDHQALRYHSESNAKVVPLSEVNLKTMVSPLLIMSNSDAKRAFAKQGQLSLALGEFAVLDPRSDSAEIYAHRARQLSHGGIKRYVSRDIQELRSEPDLMPTLVNDELWRVF
ncbi:MAG: relaxase domain-containing protein [Acidimicrobiaceae bacterium]|nr:relaxase domain-containing protein [Acidimicrobiaceae bacterium]